ncbi:MAG: hypothetical protein ACREA7_07890 [Nitrosotalea sp.]
MRLFWRKERENERNQDTSRTNKVQSRSEENDSRFDEVKTTSKKVSSRSNLGELDCEEAITQDKERFGRVRKSLMVYLREEYGNDIADRALRRVNKRRTDGYFHNTSN